MAAKAKGGCGLSLCRDLAWLDLLRSLYRIRDWRGWEGRWRDLRQASLRQPSLLGDHCVAKSIHRRLRRIRIELDRKRKGKKLSNEDWTSKTDLDAKIAKIKDGSPHLAYKPEHAVDLDTGVIVAASIHEAGKGDTATLDPTLEEAEKNCPPVDLRRHRKTLAISSPKRATTRVTF